MPFKRPSLLDNVHAIVKLRSRMKKVDWRAMPSSASDVELIRDIAISFDDADIQKFRWGPLYVPFEERRALENLLDEIRKRALDQLTKTDAWADGWLPESVRMTVTFTAQGRDAFGSVRFPPLSYGYHNQPDKVFGRGLTYYPAREGEAAHWGPVKKFNQFWKVPVVESVQMLEREIFEMEGVNIIVRAGHGIDRGQWPSYKAIHQRPMSARGKPTVKRFFQRLSDAGIRAFDILRLDEEGALDIFPGVLTGQRNGRLKGADPISVLQDTH